MRVKQVLRKTGFFLTHVCTSSLALPFCWIFLLFSIVFCQKQIYTCAQQILTEPLLWVPHTGPGSGGRE